MKKFFFTLAFFSILAVAASAQTVKYQYLDVSVKGSFMKLKDPEVDFGESTGREVANKDEILKRIDNLKNSADIKNLLDEFGWEFLDQQIIVTTYATYYLYNFRKPYKK